MLADLLQDELVALGELKDLLLQEYAALKTRDLSTLRRAADGKRVCANRLQRLTDQRRDYLCAQGLSADAAAIKVYISATQPTERHRLQMLWADWEQAAVQARRQNEINGTVIAISRGHVERALTILQGRDPRDCLYDQNAHTTFGGNHRSLARA